MDQYWWLYCILDTQLLAQERRKVFSLDGSRKTVQKMDRMHGPTDADSDWSVTSKWIGGLGSLKSPWITGSLRNGQCLVLRRSNFLPLDIKKTAETSGAISRWEKKPRKREGAPHIGMHADSGGKSHLDGTSWTAGACQKRCLLANVDKKRIDFWKVWFGIKHFWAAQLVDGENYSVFFRRASANFCWQSLRFCWQSTSGPSGEVSFTMVSPHQRAEIER